MTVIVGLLDDCLRGVDATACTVSTSENTGSRWFSRTAVTTMPRCPVFSGALWSAKGPENYGGNCPFLILGGRFE